MRHEGAIIALSAVLGFTGYALLGSFWAWLFGMDQGTMAWFAVVTMWPVIGFLLFLIGGIVFTCLAGLITLIFGVRVTVRAAEIEAQRAAREEAR
jgi:hypothetical protein